MTQPLVSVVTPVYNGAGFLAECIESVLAQTYENWEYIIADNKSSDDTLRIARAYADRDPRIKIHAFESFVSMFDNFNRAACLVDPKSRYCKFVCADDLLFPQAISRFVDIAERNPSVGIVCSYLLSGGEGASWCVRGDGLPYPSECIDGREICRWHLLGGPYVFGTPTSSMYRADLVRGPGGLFPAVSLSFHFDTSACYEHLSHWKFAFVHEVLAFERIHEEAVSTGVRAAYSYTPGHVEQLETYGPRYLTAQELRLRRTVLLDEWHGFIASRLLHGEGLAFLRLHRRMMHRVGHELSGLQLAMAVAGRVVNKLTSPRTWLRNRNEASTDRTR
jgi:glycosyltransferase involved in cell wall biosynthesis